MKKLLVILCFIAFVMRNASAEMVGLWQFDNAGNFAAATVGNDLILQGSSFAAIQGIADNDGAVRVGNNSFLVINHSIGSNGGGNFVNQWTIVYDIKCPLQSEYCSLLQTNTTNSNDGDLFIKSNGEIGVSATRYTAAGVMPANIWSRLILRVNNGNFYQIWLDGICVLEGETQAVDGRFSLENTVLLFADNDGEEDMVDVTRIALYDEALSESEIVSLGGCTPTRGPVCMWNFDDPANLTHAETGNDLVLWGDQMAVAGYNDQDGAVKIGNGSYYFCNHNINPNGGGSNVNQWSLVMDLSYNAVSELQWKCLYQTDVNNNNDGECFIDKSGRIGLASTGYSDRDDGTPQFQALTDTWYRIVIVVDNSNEYSIYVNGVKILKGDVQSIDGNFSLADGLLLFADNDGEDYPVNVSMVAIYDYALNGVQVAALKGPGGIDWPDITYILTYPYLQNVNTSGITVMWEVNQQVECSLDYSKDYNLGYSAFVTSEISGGGSVIYKTVLTGLDPGEIYNYQVIVDGIALEVSSFETAPADSVNFSFAVWSDSQGHNDGSWPTDPYEPTKAMMTDIAYSGVDFAVTVGDLAEDGDSYLDIKNYYLDRVAKYLGQTIPWFNAWGNHDNGQYSKIRKYADMPSKDRPAPYNAGYGSYSFDYAGCHFVCIDDADRGHWDWVEADLVQARANNARHIFMFVHRPPYCERWYNGESDYRTNLVPLLEEYNVDICFSGHTHEYERGWQNGVYYCITGGGSWLDHSEPLVYNWPQITVGGYHNLSSDINGGLINEYVRIDVTENGWKATMVPFSPDGTRRTDIVEAFGSPSFDNNTIIADKALQNTQYNGSVETRATDPDGLALSYSIVSGPSWLQMGSAGNYSGTPSRVHIGTNSFKIKVANIHNEYDLATLLINVNNLCDGIDGMIDFAGLSLAWNLSGSAVDASVDLDNNGVVNIDDLSILASHWLAE